MNTRIERCEFEIEFKLAGGTPGGAQPALPMVSRRRQVEWR